MRSATISRVTASALVLAVLGSAIGALTKEQVYYGNYRKYKKPAELNAKKVFMVIPAYKEIIEKNIEEDSALYLAKLAKANKTFLACVKEYAKDKGYDLVCEEGALDNATSVTDEVIKLVKKKTTK